jgi:hypothetical protein
MGTPFLQCHFGGERAPHKEGSDEQSISFGYTGWQAKPCENGNEIKERKLNPHGR